MDVQALLDNNGQDLAIRHTQDVEPILEWNKAARREEQDGDWGRHVARIPDVILIQWLDEEYANGRTDLRMFSKEFDEIIRRKLKDPDWAYLRTDKPKLQMGWL